MASFSKGCRTTSEAFDFEAVNATLGELGDQIDGFIARTGAVGTDSREFFCESRYAHQIWELNVALGDQRHFDDDEDVAGLHDRFDRLHQAVFAVNHPSADLETITWRGDARIARPKPRLAERDPRGEPDAETRTRLARVDTELVEVTVHQGRALPLGTELVGPTIIEEPTTTIVVPTGARVTVHPACYSIDLETS